MLKVSRRFDYCISSLTAHESFAFRRAVHLVGNETQEIISMPFGFIFQSLQTRAVFLKIWMIEPTYLPMVQPMRYL
jgi:hypothetical protein